MNTIQRLNDTFRRSFIGGKIVLTCRVRALPEEDIVDILTKVRAFNDFNTHNDPYNEHDYGRFLHNSMEILWKIDYYDKNYHFLSDNPANSAITNRVLTILLSSEY